MTEPLKISIIIPFVRPDGAKRCAEAIKDNGSTSLPCVYEVITAHDTERIGCPKMVKLLVGMATHDWVMFLADDTIPQAGFLQAALSAVERLPDKWGMVGLNDGVHDGNNLATHWMCHKALLHLLDGEFFHTGYLHTYCDKELLERCKQAGRYVWARDSIIKHMHPGFNTAECDYDYARIYSEDYKVHDLILYRRRRRNGWKTVT